MAEEFSTDVATIQAAPTPETLLELSKVRGRVQMVSALYELLGTEVATDTIKICKLPPGALVLPISYIEGENPGSALTLDIGDDDDTVLVDPDRYVDALDLAAGGNFLFSGASGVATATPYVTGKECWLEATVMTATTLTPDAKLRFIIFLALP